MGLPRFDKLFRMARLRATAPFVAPETGRRFHAFGLGAPKSGTHSLANLFGRFRSAHEPGWRSMIRWIVGARQGDVRQFLKIRDRRLMLEMESSHLSSYFVGELAELFPEARFVHLVRDPCSWLDSYLNDSLSRRASATWRRFRDFRFRAGEFRHAPQERVLEERGLYTLDGYLDYWANLNERVLAAVPPDRLLTVRTDRLADSTARIARFVGIAEGELRRDRVHSFRGRKKHGLLERIPPDFLRSKVEQHAGALVARWFPDVPLPGS